MSYTRLILNGDDAEAAVEELLDQIVLFVIHRRAAQAHDGRKIINDLIALLVDKVTVASLLNALGDLVHCPVERALFPMIGERRAIEHLGHAMRIDGQVKSVCAFRTERALVDRAFIVAFDVDDLAAFDIDHLAAADSAVRADALNADRAANAWSLGQRVWTDRLVFYGA